MSKDRQFGGFTAPRYTPTPDQLFDELLEPGYLTEAELRVLLYIIRRTFGWKKEADAISLKQLSQGIVRRDGTRLDWGAGVGRAAASRASKSLEAKGIIRARRSPVSQAGDSDEPETTVYTLVMAADGGGIPKIQPLYSKDTALSTAGNQPPVSQRDPQETDVTINNEQEADGAEFSSGEPGEPPYAAWIAQTVLDYARELGDAAGAAQHVHRALVLWQRTGLSEESFVERLHAAKAAARKRQGRGRQAMNELFRALEEG